MLNAERASRSVSSPSAVTISFDAQLAGLKSDCIALWHNSSDQVLSFGEEHAPEDQARHEAQLDEIVLSMKSIDTDSHDTVMRHLQQLKSSVRNLVVRSVEPNLQSETDSILKEFSEAGDEFVRQASEFDPGLSVEDIFQALRNLWIVNSMQVGLHVPVRVSPSGLAYSLLYPYTDNFLDDRKISPVEKRDFSNRFKCRLSGSAVRAATPLELKTWDLVSMIESEYPRCVFPEVYHSLLAIHAGQEKSLWQHYLPGRKMHSDLLDISVEKGGSSVLADAYLAKGVLSMEEAEFSFGYGVFLQFIDDLQDVKDDLRNGHHTLFTRAAARGALDGMANRLYRFVDEILGSRRSEDLDRPATLTELVRQSCRVLIIESIARSPELYTDQFVSYAERHSPVRFSRIRSLHDKVNAKQAGIRKVLKGKKMFAVAAACV
jgi:hypothetical protein